MLRSVYLSVCVCLSVREHISGTAGPIFTKFFTQIPCGRGAVLLWRRCDIGGGVWCPWMPRYSFVILTIQTTVCRLTRRSVTSESGPMPPNSTEVRLEHGPMWYCLNGDLPSMFNVPPFSLWRYVICTTSHTDLVTDLMRPARNSGMAADYGSGIVGKCLCSILSLARFKFHKRVSDVSTDIDGKYLLRLFNRASMVISALFLFSYWPPAKPLHGAHGTLRFRGTPVEKHWPMTYDVEGAYERWLPKILKLCYQINH